MASTPEIAVVYAWHEALNSSDIDRLIVLSAEDIEVGGPRGSGHGAELLREWFGRAGIRLTPLKYFQRDEAVVVEQDAEWRDPGTGEVSGRQTLASVFVVRAGRVASVLRYPDVTSALTAAGISETAV